MSKISGDDHERAEHDYNERRSHQQGVVLHLQDGVEQRVQGCEKQADAASLPALRRATPA